MPWWAECKQRSTFPLRNLGTIILPSMNTSPLSVLSWYRTSQKSQTSGSVRQSLEGNPWLFISCVALIISAWCPNVVRCHGCVIVTRIHCCLDGGKFHFSCTVTSIPECGRRHLCFCWRKGYHQPLLLSIECFWLFHRAYMCKHHQKLSILGASWDT